MRTYGRSSWNDNGATMEAVTPPPRMDSVTGEGIDEDQLGRFSSQTEERLEQYNSESDKMVVVA